MLQTVIEEVGWRFLVRYWGKKKLKRYSWIGSKKNNVLARFSTEMLNECTYSHRNCDGKKRSKNCNEALHAVASNSASASNDSSFIAFATFFCRICESTKNKECSTLSKMLQSYAAGPKTILRHFKIVSSFQKHLWEQTESIVAQSEIEKTNIS